MTTTEQPTRYVMPSEAAAILCVDTKTVARWAKEGKLPFIRTLGGHRRFPEAELRALMTATTTAERPKQ